MKIITKEWKNCYDLLGVIYDLRKETGWKLPVLIRVSDFIEDEDNNGEKCSNSEFAKRVGVNKSVISNIVKKSCGKSCIDL